MRNLQAKIVVFIFLVALKLPVFSQTIEQLKNRFALINYHGSLNEQVKISAEKIIIYNGKQTEFILEKDKWQKFAMLLKTLPEDSLEKIYLNKTLLNKYTGEEKHTSKKENLNGLKIMIDPGHMAGNMAMARTEQKFVHFDKLNNPTLKQDSIDIAEGMLTYQTASILKKMLEEKGATVALTRKDNSTSFGCIYKEWLAKNKQKVLDSLLQSQKITAQKHKQLMSLNAGKFFVDFFKDYELQQRARVINAYKPDLAVIIHYNVDEKNVPWTKPSDKNYCMTFIPGCLTADNIKSTSQKINLLRLLLTTDLDKSQQISSMVVHELSAQLTIPIAKPSDATYLTEHCTSTSFAGVYCRNLALCRMVQTPLVYGECLYQDNETECYNLSKNNESSFGIKTNKRVVLAAQSFYNAIMAFYSENK